MTCDGARRAIPLYYYGELAAEEEERFEDHVDGCAECRAEMERHRAVLAAVDRGRVEEPAGLLAECRHDLMRAVYRQEAPLARHENGSAWRRFEQAIAEMFSPLARLRLPLGATALVALGYFSAQVSLRPGAGITAAALAEPPIASVRSVQPDASGNVRLVLDETRRRVVSGTLNDPNIQNLLLAAARDESNPGVRVESVDILKSHAISAEIRAALLNAAASDPNPGVRLKALEGLKPYAGDPEVRKTLAQVLTRDDNPGVRIQVIDMLTAQHDDALVGVLQSLVDRDSNGYVRLRCEKALRDMHASIGTF